MDDDAHIDALRARLNTLTGQERLPVLVQLAQVLANRYEARARSGRARPGNLDESITLLREARGLVRPGDSYRAQVAFNLGMLNAVRSLAGGTAADRDEAIDCLTEGIEHRDISPAAVEMGLIYTAMLRMVRAIPDGLDVLGGTGLGTGLGHVNILDPTVGAAAMAYWRQATSGLGLADLDAAIAALRRVGAAPPVNPQIHALAGPLLAQITMLRALLGGDMAGLMANMQTLMTMWGPAAGGFGGPGFPGPAQGPVGLDALRALLPPVSLPQITQRPTDHLDR